jgi:hypothetical protein
MGSAILNAKTHSDKCNAIRQTRTSGGWEMTRSFAIYNDDVGEPEGETPSGYPTTAAASHLPHQLSIDRSICAAIDSPSSASQPRDSANESIV